MTTPLTFSTGSRPDGGWVLAVVGEIDMSNAETFATALAGAAATAADAPLVVDLTKVEYLDSAGLAALFAHAERIEILATSLLAPVLSISGLADLTTVRAD
ncbi:STAS domain-containing protein [Micromonospora krabiensis]|uniref:Anti-anti-sigma factor n=1 Tax=Micromonospora krabiensis TaxID=307121 RepID=A0A1C3MZA6_9ACTN|nr:STAS domain-containing protein [Micromonospora krabiensis]SBV25677.1 anti-anti-sigma factor [Micromonospora krabiensis]